MSHPESESPLDLAAAYALGALTPEETREFEAYLARSPEARREVDEYREVASLIALGGSDAGPGSDLRGRVLARVGAERSRSIRPTAPVRRVPPFAWGVLAASLVAALGLGAGLLALRRELGSLRAELSRQNMELAQTRARLAAREATLNAIFEPSVELFQLTSTGDPEPVIQIFWDRARNTAIVHGFGLRPVPQGRAYQLWFMRDGKPVPSVTFKPEPSGHAKVEKVGVPGGRDVSAAAITVEPESGSQQPTSAVVMIGSLKKS